MSITTGIIMAIIGAIAGSFLCLISGRFRPHYRNSQWFLVLLSPRSCCDHCQRCLSPADLIPVISWCLLAGRCRYCKQRISASLPCWELLSALLFILAPAVEPQVIPLCAMLLFTAALVILSDIDRRYLLLPDAITLPLLWGGLLFHCFFSTMPLQTAFIGAIAGYLSLAFLAGLYRLVHKKEGLGFGDVKLFSALGAWCGWQVLPLIALLAASGGLLYGLLCFTRARRQPQKKQQPFGPWLAAAGWLVFMSRYQENNIAILSLVNG